MYTYNGVVRNWHDGDTCHVDLDLGFGFILDAYDLDGKPIISCRTYGINAPELVVAGQPNPAGLAATAYANSLCPAGTKVVVTSHGWDKYGGRFDGSITLPDGTDFSARMLAAGQAVAYKV